MSGGQTGTVDVHGKIDVDPIPNYNKQAPVRYAYLTVIDPKTGENLWSDSHRWGGLLTGINSVGARLVKELEEQTRNRRFPSVNSPPPPGVLSPVGCNNSEGRLENP
jgi:hypothetical protein